MQEFRIKEYGRMELAMMYSPGIAPESAWRKLKRWMQLSPGLLASMRGKGYDGRSRSFTPAQVRLIVEALGEP